MTAIAIEPLDGPIAHLDGAPFLDDSFNTAALLSMVAAARTVEAEHTGLASPLSPTRAADASRWLSPSGVYQLRPGEIAMPARPFPPGCKRQVKEALDELGEGLPAWRNLLALPVRYARLFPDRGAVSASSRSWPQHVLLADAAFADRAVLRCQLVHELAHQWLYLVQEIWPLQTRGQQDLTLPSGTSHRSLAEVIGAVHVVTTTVRMHRVFTDAAPERLEFLTRYGQGCLKLIRAHRHDLTPAGAQFTQRMEDLL
jgi:hypothetical protein